MQVIKNILGMIIAINFWNVMLFKYFSEHGLSSPNDAFSGLIEHTVLVFTTLISFVTTDFLFLTVHLWINNLALRRFSSYSLLVWIKFFDTELPLEP